jgi:hypothetical protein
MCQAGLRRLGTPAAETIILGDQLDTDITLGVKHGLVSVLTMTGETSAETLAKSAVQPDLVVQSPAELLAILRDVGAPLVGGKTRASRSADNPVDARAATPERGARRRAEAPEGRVGEHRDFEGK